MTNILIAGPAGVIVMFLAAFMWRLETYRRIELEGIRDRVRALTSAGDAPGPAELGSYRTAPIFRRAPQSPPLRAGLAGCPFCGNVRVGPWLRIAVVGARCSWWRRLRGCAEKREHIHAVCSQCDARWACGPRVETTDYALRSARENV